VEVISDSDNANDNDDNYDDDGGAAAVEEVEPVVSQDTPEESPPEEEHHEEAAPAEEVEQEEQLDEDAIDVEPIAVQKTKGKYMNYEDYVGFNLDTSDSNYDWNGECTP
jgi:hypothetical protein